MSGFLIVSDLASTAQRLSLLLARDRPHSLLHQVDNWPAAQSLASQQPLACVISVHAWHPLNLQGLSAMRRLLPRVNMIWFVDKVPSSGQRVLQQLAIRTLPEEALDTLFSGVNTDAWHSLQH